MSIKTKMHISTDVLSDIACSAIVVGDDFVVTTDLTKITVTVMPNGDLTLNHTKVGEGLRGCKPSKETINGFLKRITERLMPAW
jgi:hypothetical protein